MKLENLPWVATNTEVPYMDPAIEGKRANGNPVYIGRIYRSIGLTDPAETAREIAHRCNVHDEREALIQELMTALEELVAEFDADDLEAQKNPGCGGIVETGGIILARAAISKATGGES